MANIGEKIKAKAKATAKWAWKNKWGILVTVVGVAGGVKLYKNSKAQTDYENAPEALPEPTDEDLGAVADDSGKTYKIQFVDEDTGEIVATKCTCTEEYMRDFADL